MIKNIVFHTLLFLSVLEAGRIIVERTPFLSNMSLFFDFLKFDCTLYTVCAAQQHVRLVYELHCSSHLTRFEYASNPHLNNDCVNGMTKS
jgi:hypothetical protein